MESIVQCSTRAMPMTKYNLSLRRSICFGMNDVGEKKKDFSFREKPLNNIKGAMN